MTDENKIKAAAAALMTAIKYHSCQKRFMPLPDGILETAAKFHLFIMEGPCALAQKHISPEAPSLRFT